MLRDTMLRLCPYPSDEGEVCKTHDVEQHDRVRGRWKVLFCKSHQSKRANMGYEPTVRIGRGFNG